MTQAMERGSVATVAGSTSILLVFLAGTSLYAAAAGAPFVAIGLTLVLCTMVLGSVGFYFAGRAVVP